jgi:hypothetical protein
MVLIDKRVVLCEGLEGEVLDEVFKGYGYGS